MHNILRMILTSRVYDAAQETLLEAASDLSAAIDNHV